MRIFAVMMCCLLTVCSPCVWAQQAIAEQLQAADNLRTSDRKQFNDLLLGLQQARQEMSQADIDYLDFLVAFRDNLEGKHEQAITVLQRIVAGHGQLELRFRAAITLAQIQILRRQFVETFTALAQALNWIEQIPNPAVRIEGLLAAANIYSEAGLFDQSLSYLDMLEQMKITPRSQCIGQILRLQNQRLSGMMLQLDAANSVLNLCQDANQPLLTGFAALQLLYVHSQHKDYVQMQQAALQLAPLIEQAAYPRLSVEYFQLKATAEFQLGLIADAQSSLSQLLEFSKNAPQSTPAVAGYKLAAEVAAKQGDYQKAYELHQQYSEAEQTLRDDKSLKLLAYQLAKVDMLKKDQQLSLMQEQIRSADLQQLLSTEQAWRNRVLLIAASSLVLVLVVGLLRLIQRHRFYKIAAESDSLTAISNRFHFEQQFNRALNRSKQHNTAIGLIVFDLDCFKQINEQYGHDVGDKALQAVVNICNHFIRSGDIFGRIGGEEFAIALPDCQPDKVLMMAEICRDAIEQLDCSAIAPQLKMTASFGVSNHLYAGYQAADMMRQADQALYLAKYHGRNRVETYDRMSASTYSPDIAPIDNLNSPYSRNSAEN